MAKIAVAPLVGAWIEIHKTLLISMADKSLPSWERGLKFCCSHEHDHKAAVAPLVGAWIEIVPSPVSVPGVVVAPLVGAWIEICHRIRWQCGSDVAPLVGAWIEIKIDIPLE